jgi:hypothetical protein
MENKLIGMVRIKLMMEATVIIGIKSDLPEFPWYPLDVVVAM